MRNYSQGNLILPRGGERPKDFLRVESWDGETLTAFPEGGGLQYKFPLSAVEKFDFEIVTEYVPVLKKGKFSLDDSPSWSGYSFEDNWNGWACPLFPLEEMRKIIEWLKSRDPDGRTDSPQFKFDKAENVVVTEWDGREHTTTVDTGEIVNGLRLYGSVAFSGWCWWDDSWSSDDRREQEGGDR